MNYRYYLILLLFTLQLLLIGVSYSDYAAGEPICCYSSDLNEVGINLAGSCESNEQNIILGGTDSGEGLDSIDNVDNQCVQAVLDNGVNCKLSTGEYGTGRFYIEINGNYYPQRDECEAYESVTNIADLAWYTGSTGSGGGTTGGDEDNGVVIIDPGRGDSDDYTIPDEDLGRTPFSGSSNNQCSASTPFGEMFLSKSACEARGDNCVYDPYRIGSMAQREGDSNPEGVFSLLKPDSMCVSKPSEIRSCEDIRSQNLCENYETELSPNENSLMGIYGCEWIEINARAGKCITKDLYFEDQTAKDSGDYTFVNVENSIRRQNLITNPLFERTDGSGSLSYWTGSYSLGDSTDYNNLEGSNYVKLSSSDSISQLISGVPANVELELKVITSQNSRLRASVDSEVLMISKSNPLFSFNGFNSSLKINTFTYVNTIKNADLSLTIDSENSADILAVSLSLPQADVSGTEERAISNIYPENMFPQDSFMCSLCQVGFSSDFCKEDIINKFGNCELVAPDTLSRYQSNIAGTVNPYTQSPEEEKNTFIEEDMVFCGVYSQQPKCEDENNKLNSVIADYHNSNTLCKWEGSQCIKDSDGDGLPDTTSNGQLSELSSSDPNAVFNDYKITANSDDSLNDFQLSCDVLPPRFSIIPYKKILNSSGDVETVPATGTHSSTPGVLDFVVINLEEPVSPQCDVFENYESSVTLNLINDSEQISVQLDSILDEYEKGTRFFQKAYPYDQFRASLDSVYPHDVDEFLQNGEIVAYDRAGNKQKLSHEFSSTQLLPKPDFEIELSPSSDIEIYPATTLTINNLLDSSTAPEIESCDITVTDVDNNFDEIVDAPSTSNANISSGFNIGERISQFENAKPEADQRESFPVNLFMECRDIFGQVATELVDYTFSNQDEIIVHQFGEASLFNPDGIRYINPNTMIMDLELSARDDVSCSDSYLEDASGNTIQEMGTIAFETGSPVDGYNQSYTTTLDFTSLSDNGIYSYVLDCEFLGDSFQKELKFEYDNSPVSVDDAYLQDRDDLKWEFYNGNLYINAVGRNLVSSSGIVETGNFNNYLKANTNVFIDAPEEEINKLNDLSLCSSDWMNVDSNTTQISEDVLGNLDTSECEVQYDPEQSSSTLKLISIAELRTTTGLINEHEIETYFDVRSPTISASIAGGGEAVDNTIYYNSNNIEFVIDMGLLNSREFTCDIEINADGNTFSTTQSSNNGEIQITSNEITGNPNAIALSDDKEITFECEEEIFSHSDSETYSLVEDTTPPEILSIDFTDIGTNWGYPLVGDSEINSSVLVQLNKSEEFVNCEYRAVDVGANSFIETSNPQDIDAIGTSTVENMNALILTKEAIVESDSNPYFVITSGSITDSSEVNHSVRVTCQDGAGNEDTKVFDGFKLNLFDYGEMDAQGVNDVENNLDIIIESLTNLEDYSIRLIDSNTGDVLVDDEVSAMAHTTERNGPIHQLFIDNVIDLSGYESTPNYPFEIELSSSDIASFNDEFNVLIDSDAPIVDISVNTNDDNVIYADSVSGQITVIDEPSFSPGLEEVIVTISSNEAGVVEQLTYDEDIGTELVQGLNYEDVAPGMYSIEVEARDKSGNSQTASSSFEVSDEFSVSLLQSSNTFISSSYPLTWYTQSQEPTLRFETTKPAESCKLTPGDEQGYYGVQHDFNKVGSNRFELDLSTVSSFDIREGRRKVIVSCIPTEDTELNYDIAVFLYLVNTVPDYTVEFDWGQTQYVLPSESTRNVTFQIDQKSEFRDVTCESSVVSAGGSENVELSSSEASQTGSYKGSFVKGSGEYVLEVVCENPLGKQGPVKQYDVSILDEGFDINIISMKGSSDSNINIDVSETPLKIPESTSNYDLQFSTNYQSENLECEVDVSESGFINFIESLLFNTKLETDQDIERLGTYEVPVEITDSTEEIAISCSEGSIFSSSPITFPVERFNPSEPSISVENVQGEK